MDIRCHAAIGLLTTTLLAPATLLAFSPQGVLGNLEGPARHIAPDGDAQARFAQHPGWRH